MAGSSTGVENIQCESEACYGGRKKESTQKQENSLWCRYVREILGPSGRGPDSQHWNNLSNKIT